MANEKKKQKRKSAARALVQGRMNLVGANLAMYMERASLEDDVREAEDALAEHIALEQVVDGYLGGVQVQNLGPLRAYQRTARHDMLETQLPEEDFVPRRRDYLDRDDTAARLLRSQQAGDSDFDDLDDEDFVDDLPSRRRGNRHSDRRTRDEELDRDEDERERRERERNRRTTRQSNTPLGRMFRSLSNRVSGRTQQRRRR